MSSRISGSSGAKPAATELLLQTFDTRHEVPLLRHLKRDGRLTSHDLRDEDTAKAASLFVETMSVAEKASMAADREKFSGGAIARLLEVKYPGLFHAWKAKSKGNPDYSLFGFGYDSAGEPSQRAAKVNELAQHVRTLNLADQALFHAIADVLVPPDQVRRFRATLRSFGPDGMLRSPAQTEPIPPEMVPEPAPTSARKALRQTAFAFAGTTTTLGLLAASPESLAFASIATVVGVGGGAAMDRLIRNPREH